LPSCTFFPGTPDARKNLELFDVDPIGEPIRLVASVKVTVLPIRAKCRHSNCARIYVLALMPQSTLKSEEGALSLKTFQFELAKRTRRNKLSQPRVRGFTQAARYT